MIAVVVARDSLYTDRKEGEREKTREIMSEDEVQGGRISRVFCETYEVQ